MNCAFKYFLLFRLLVLGFMCSVFSRRVLAVLAVFVVMAAALGGYFYYVSLPVRKPLIGVIRVEGYLLFDVDRRFYLGAVESALRNDSIKAVVLRVDSGGGEASICEEVYEALRRLSESKPVVAVVEGIAASGGFYLLLAADYIYSTPGSFVGNVGVIAYAPSIALPSEAVLETGAYKFTGFSVREFPLVLEGVVNAFIQAVRDSRGGRLKVSLDEVASGKLFSGLDAARFGLVDEVGSYLDAVEKAADMAGLKDYEVVDLTERRDALFQGSLSGYDVWKRWGKIPFSLIANISDLGYYVFYVPPYMVREVSPGDYSSFSSNLIMAENGLNASGRIVVDLAHDNYFPAPLLSEFLGRIVEGGGRLYFFKGGGLEAVLNDSPRAFIVFCPRKEYSWEEIKAITKFVEGGGKLLLVYDPSAGFPLAINVLAQEFGMFFGSGYLYSGADKYGIYRNVVVKNFSNSNLTRNVRELVILTGSSIYTNSTWLAYTGENVYISILDRKGKYAVVAINKSVLALGDASFLLDPYLELADNRVFLENLIDWLLSRED